MGMMAGGFAASNQRPFKGQFDVDPMDWIEEWLSLPLVGPMRQRQSELNQWLSALIRQMRATARLSQHGNGMISDALQRFAHWIEDDNGPPVTTLAALFDGWVEQAEAAYQKVAGSEAYCSDFADCVNAAVEAQAAFEILSSQASRHVVQTATAPSAREHGAQSQQQPLWQQVVALREEVATLKSELAQHQSRGDGAPNETDRPATAGRAEGAKGSKPARKTRRKPANATTATKARTTKKRKSTKSSPRRTKASVSEFDIGGLGAPASSGTD